MQWAWHGKGEQAHSLLNKAAAGEHSWQMVCPAQASKKHNSHSWPASQQNNSRRRRWPASRRAVQVGGGSAVVLATQQAGSDLPNRLPPTYRLCLSLYITTHSLNLKNPI